MNRNRIGIALGAVLMTPFGLAALASPASAGEGCASLDDLSYTYDGINSGDVTLLGNKSLCEPFYVRAASWTYDNPPAQWPQTGAGSQLVVIDEPGVYPYVAPVIGCGQYDVYAGETEDSVAIPDHLTGSGQPFEPAFLHQFVEGEKSPTWYMTGTENCTPPTTTTPPPTTTTVTTTPPPTTATETQPPTTEVTTSTTTVPPATTTIVPPPPAPPTAIDAGLAGNTVEPSDGVPWQVTGTLAAGLALILGGVVSMINRARRRS